MFRCRLDVQAVYIARQLRYVKFPRRCRKERSEVSCVSFGRDRETGDPYDGHRNGPEAISVRSYTSQRASGNAGGHARVLRPESHTRHASISILSRFIFIRIRERYASVSLRARSSAKLGGRLVNDFSPT